MKRTDRGSGEADLLDRTASETPYCQGDDCGQVLTDPVSIARGYGPKCWAARQAGKKDAMTSLAKPAPFRFAVIGDTLLVSEEPRGVTIMNRAADVLAQINRTLKPIPPLVYFTDRNGQTIQVLHKVGKLVGISAPPAGTKRGVV